MPRNWADIVEKEEREREAEQTRMEKYYRKILHITEQIIPLSTEHGPDCNGCRGAKRSEERRLAVDIYEMIVK